MNQKLGRKRRDAAWQQSHLHGWGHDRKKMLKLSSETLYAFGVLSNVFHEVMFLHKAS